MNRIKPILEIGEWRGKLVGVGPSPNTHGCGDYAVFRVIKPASAIGQLLLSCIEAQSCHSCWQVGHGREHVFASVSKVYLCWMEDLVENTSSAVEVDFELSGHFWPLFLNR